MDLIFTDLDGTLLDRDTYAWEAARPALDRLRCQGIPWVLVTSKTRAEVEYWRRCLENEHPYIVENGAAACVPPGYFPYAVQGGKRRGVSESLEWGTPYAELVADLQSASLASRCRVRGFHEMTPEEVAGLCGLPLEQAVLAKRREYDEPFLVLDTDRAGALAAAIEARGKQWTRGGRFWHILGANDKALAVGALRALFERGNAPGRTIGLGDGLNDVSFLNVVDEPVLIRSAQVAELKARVPRGVVTDRPGPAGWNAAILALIHG
jgi:mannosyl-3-phosphoglycerate phosphatase